MPEFEIKDFTAGYVDGIDSNLIPPNAAKWSENWLSKTIGKLEKREGQSLKYPLFDPASPIRGMHSYYYGLGLTERRHLVLCNGTVGYWTGEVFTSIKTGLSTTLPTYFETCVNYVVGFNGSEAPWKWDGTDTTPLAEAPALGRFPVMFKEKLFVVASGDPSLLVWSDSFQPEQWPGVNYWPVKDGDGDEITGLHLFMDELVVFKNRSIHSLRGTSLDDFRLDELDSQVGCVGQLAIAQHQNRLYFVGSQGLYQFNGMTATNISDQSIPNFWKRVNKSYLNQAVVGFWEGFVLFALPIDESTTNNIVLAYRPMQEGQGTWWPLKGITPTQFITFDTGSGVEFYSGNYGGGVVKHGGVTADFGTTPILSQWEGFAMDAQRAENEKKAKRAFLRLSPSSVVSPELQVSLDEADYESLTLERTDDLVSRYRFNTKRFRYISVKFKHSGITPCEVRGIYVPFKMKRKPKVRLAVSS